MRQKVITVYSVNELSEQAKQQAHHEYLGEDNYFWDDENIASLDAFAKVFPVHVITWEYDYCRGNVRFEFSEDEAIQDLAGNRLATYIYNNYFEDITKGKYYSLWSKTEKNPKNLSIGKLKQRHSKVMITREGACPFTGYYMDDVLLAPIFDFLKKPDSRNFYELLTDCFQEWADACVNDYKATLSFEYFIEHAEANDYEYYEDGTRY